MPESLRLSSLPSLRGQRGSTLTGLIIGLIIGLGIAVAVALVITKGSTPFTDKSGKGKLTEPTAGQVSDPNKPLYSSKEAARAANKELAAKAPAADADPLAKVIATISTEHPAAATGAAPVKAPAAVAAPAVAAPAATAKPETGTRADAVVKAAADAAGASGDDKFVYYLQAGAFREMADAETTRAKLALLGFEAAITDRTTDAGVLHRVRTGPYQQVDAMNKARAKLLDSGIDVAIVRNQK
jgi:cell division protein FtsN